MHLVKIHQKKNDENPEKIRLVVISSQNDTIKIHTNATSLRNLNMENIAIHKREEIKESNFQKLLIYLKWLEN